MAPPGSALTPYFIFGSEAGSSQNPTSDSTQWMKEQSWEGGEEGQQHYSVYESVFFVQAINPSLRHPLSPISLLNVGKVHNHLS